MSKMVHVVQYELSEESAEEKGGVFGTGKDADRWRDWFKLLGLVVGVYYFLLFQAGETS